MLSLESLNQRLQLLLRPVVRSLAAMGVTPGRLTMVNVAGSIMVGLLLSGASTLGSLLLLAFPVWMLVRTVLMALWDLMARETAAVSRVRGLLREISDVTCDLALYLPLAGFDSRARLAVFAFSVGIVMTEFCGVAGALVGGRRQQGGPMGRTVRAIVVSCVLIPTAFVSFLGFFWLLPFWIFVVLQAVTCWNRVHASVTEAARS